MDRAVHPELVKRIVVTDTATKKTVLHTPRKRQQKEVAILDIFGNAASVKSTMADWIDYMQMA